MTHKLYLIFAYFAFIRGNPSSVEIKTNTSSSIEARWKEELRSINYETLSTCVKDVMKIRPSVDNVEFSPTAILIVTAMMLLKTLYFIDISSAEGSRTFQSLPDEKKSEHLEQAKRMSELVKLLENASNGMIKVNTVVFLLRPPTLKMKAYAEYMKKLFKSDVMEADFSCSRQSELIELLKNWKLKKGKGYPRMWNDYLTPSYGVTYTQACLITFAGCWDTSKFVEKSVLQGNFIHNDEITPTTMLAGKAFVGYHHFKDLKVEALSLPYIGDKFATLIVMPNQNESLNVFEAINDTDYQNIFERVSNTSEYVDLEIPFMDVGNIIMNENGTTINIQEILTCESSLYRKPEGNVDFKIFRLNRPFGVFVYHKESKSVFFSVLLKNPISKIKWEE